MYLHTVSSDALVSSAYNLVVLRKKTLFLFILVQDIAT